MAEEKRPGKKRRLRAPAETIREKATKAQETATQPPKRGWLRQTFSGFFWPLKMLGKGVGWLGHRPPLKQIGHGLRWFFSLRFMRFIGKLLGISFLINSWKDLKLVTWPTIKESRQLTFAVIVFSIIFGALIAVVDLGLDKLFKQLILK